jgi:hypothetical protein
LEIKPWDALGAAWVRHALGRNVEMAGRKRDGIVEMRDLNRRASARPVSIPEQIVRFSIRNLIEVSPLKSKVSLADAPKRGLGRIRLAVPGFTTLTSALTS